MISIISSRLIFFTMDFGEFAVSFVYTAAFFVFFGKTRTPPAASVQIFDVFDT